MTLLHRTRLERRLALHIGVALGLFVLVLGVVIFGLGYRKQLADARERQDQLAHTVQTSAAVAAFARNPEIADDVIQGLTGNSYVLAARIDSPEGFKHERSRQTGLDWATAPATVYDLPSPMGTQDSVGMLRIVPDRERIQADALIYGMGYAALPLLEILAAVVVIAVLIRQLVGKPVAAIAHSLSSIDPGQQAGVRVQVPSGHEDDEIGLLARSANRLIDATETALEKERELRHQVQAMEERYRHIFQTTNTGIMVLTPQGRLINSNPVLLDKIVGIPLSQQEAVSCPDFLAAIFTNPDSAWGLVHEAAVNQHVVEADLQLKTADDTVRWAHAICSATLDKLDHIESIEAVLIDVTARRLKEDEVRTAAERDPLTGLYNRRGYELFLDKALRRAGEDGVSLGILMMDLDGFKQVNDEQGHAAGDEVLKTVAQRLQTRVRRSSDLVGRLGGDEFVVIRHDCGQDPALLESLAADLVQLVGQPIGLTNGAEVRVGISIGLAVYPQHGSLRQALLHQADEAMYAVKRGGKNGYAWPAAQA